MAKRTAKKKEVPLGKAIIWTDSQLDALSEISPADIIEAGQWWKQNAPKKYKNLLDAKPENDATT